MFSQERVQSGASSRNTGIVDSVGPPLMVSLIDPSYLRVPWRLNLCLSVAVLVTNAAFLFGAPALTESQPWWMVLLQAALLTPTPTPPAGWCTKEATVG
jgi:hypothetical protein